MEWVINKELVGLEDESNLDDWDEFKEKADLSERCGTDSERLRKSTYHDLEELYQQFRIMVSNWLTSMKSGSEVRNDIEEIIFNMDLPEYERRKRLYIYLASILLSWFYPDKEEWEKGTGTFLRKDCRLIGTQDQCTGSCVWKEDENGGKCLLHIPESTELSDKKGERVVGTAQMAGTEMMRVADMKSIEVRVDVGENDITKVKIGDTALVEVDAYNNRKFKGIVYKIANPVSTATSAMASSTEVANYKVHIRLFTESYQDLIKENAKFPFRPGMTASADIQTKSKVNVISVPLNAVTTRDKEGQGKETKVSSNATTTNEEPAKPDEEMSEVVFVLQKDNKVKMIKVKTDIQDLNYIQVEGVKVGDVVITGPYSTVSKSLKDGELVKPVTKEKLFEEKK